MQRQALTLSRSRRGTRVQGPRARLRYLVAPILNIFVPHSGQVPCVAGRPFFMVTGLASLIGRWVLHFMQ